MPHLYSRPSTRRLRLSWRLARIIGSFGTTRLYRISQKTANQSYVLRCTLGCEMHLRQPDDLRKALGLQGRLLPAPIHVHGDLRDALAAPQRPVNVEMVDKPLLYIEMHSPDGCVELIG